MCVYLSLSIYIYICVYLYIQYYIYTRILLLLLLIRVGRVQVPLRPDRARSPGPTANESQGQSLNS